VEALACLRMAISHHGEALDIHHRGRHDRLELRLCLTMVACLPESMPPAYLADLALDLGAWPQSLPECSSLLGSLLCGSCLLQHRLMEVQLDLAAGRLPDGVLDASGPTAEAAVVEGTGSTGLSREAEEAHRPVLLVSRHPEVRRGHAVWTGHTPLSVVGAEIDDERVLAQVLRVGDRSQLGHHLDVPLAQGCSGIGGPIDTITVECSLTWSAVLVSSPAARAVVISRSNRTRVRLCSISLRRKTDRTVASKPVSWRSSPRACFQRRSERTRASVSPAPLNQQIPRRAVIGEFRGFGRGILMFADFPRDVQSFRVRVTRQELRRVLYIAYDYWIELSGGSCSPEDAAQRIRQGITAFGLSNHGLWSLADAVKSGAVFPELILVAANANARLVVIDGHARLTSHALAPKHLPAEVNAIVGYSAGMTAWGLY
jgi:hypothetical protein